MRFLKSELIDLSKAYVAITLAFGIFFSRGSLGLAEALGVSAIAVGAGFIVHELAHKFVAQHFNCTAHFKSDDRMLVLAVLLALFLPVVIAAPGAVVISNVTNRRSYGKISASGPAANIVLALLFLGASFFITSPIAFYGFRINALLALFNLIPFGPFDGKKIKDWNVPVYYIMLAASAIMFFLL